MVQIPSNYDNNTRYPLVMVLHGGGVDGNIQSVYLGLFDRVGSPMPKPDFDLVANIGGAETSRIAWPDCLHGTEVEFWTIHGGPHIPFPWVQAGLDSFIDWLLDHRRA